MNTTELVQEIKRLSTPDRLKIIAATTALIQEDLVGDDSRDAQDVDEQMRRAALEVKEFYEPGGELTEWTVLDAEEFLDDSVGENANDAVKG